jgi:phosphatidylinositol-3-phosphatase
MAASLAPISTHSRSPRGASSVDHVTIVIMENRSYREIIGNPDAAYINALASKNALFTNSYAVAHPSEPNYLALYSGSTQGIHSDACPLQFSGPSLGGELVRAKKSVKGYMEDLPAVGSPVCSEDAYARKHDPLIDFADTPAQSVVPYSQIASDLSANTYPSVAFVVPNLRNDMHDGTIAMGDAWLAANLPPILEYDATHRGLLILTWDEDDSGSGNQIATIAVGPLVISGRYSQKINHYDVLTTVTDVFDLPALSAAPPLPAVLR